MHVCLFVNVAAASEKFQVCQTFSVSLIYNILWVRKQLASFCSLKCTTVPALIQNTIERKAEKRRKGGFVGV